MAIPSQAEYERNELAQFRADLRRVENAPLRERQEDAREFAKYLREDPELIVQRIGWLFDGNYGYGSYVEARHVLRSRMNKAAWALITIAALEFRTTNAYARKAYNALSPSQKAHLNGLIDREIRGAEEQLAENDGRDPARRKPQRQRKAYPPYPHGKRKVEKVLEEFKAHKLRSSSGQKVTSRKQAIAIALSEQRRAEGMRSKRDPSCGCSYPKRDMKKVRIRREVGPTGAAAWHFGPDGLFVYWNGPGSRLRLGKGRGPLTTIEFRGADGSYSTLASADRAARHFIRA